MLSISTSWFNPEKMSVKDWLTQVKSLGADAVELSYKVTDKQLIEFEKFLSEVGLGVSSIHNFCPTPNDEPSDRHISNYYRLSALDDHEREQAIKWTKIAVDTAARVKAKVVVIHAGTVDFEDNRAPRLFELYNDGQKDSKEFELERERILIMREEKREPYLQALRKSLSDVTSHAQENGIQIGLETRYYPLEIPNFDEIGYFLNIFKSNGMGYWHDVGHAEVNSLLGITPHLDFLKKYKKQLSGVHLHDLKGTKDHHAPFEGEIGLDSYLSYFGKNVLRVIESKSYASAEAMKKAIEKLKRSV